MHTAGNFEFDVWYTGLILKTMSQITMEISSELSSSITKGILSEPINFVYKDHRAQPRV